MIVGPVSFLLYLWLAREQQRRAGAVQVSYREMAESVGVSKIRTGSCELARATQTGWSHEEKFDGDFLLHGTPSLDCGRKTRAVGFRHTLNPVPSLLLVLRSLCAKGASGPRKGQKSTWS